MRFGAVVLAAGATVALAACGDAGSDEPREPRSGDGGAVEAYVTDRGADPGASGTEAGTASSQDGEPRLRGTFRGNFIVSIYSPDRGFWVDLGRRAEVDVPLGDAQGRNLLTGAGVPAGTYTRVRVTLCHSSAEVASGSRVEDLLVEAPAHVHLTETGDMRVERETGPFHVAPDRPTRIEIDLNSEGWLTRGAVESGAASVPDFERVVHVEVGPASS